MTIPLALYVHIPWCVRKCAYCDFNAHAVTTASHADTHTQAGAHEYKLPEEDVYIDALLSDLKQDWASCTDKRRLCSVFIGGGTPSLLSVAALGRLLEGIAQCCGLDKRCEISMEANPGTVEYGKFSGFRAAGINRLSIGVQSFDPTQLKRLGRIHSAEDAVSAVRAAQAANFDNINIDLMYGLPEQNAEAAMTDIRRAIALEPQHISWYQLTIEPNTYFYSKRPSLPVEDTVCAQYEGGSDILRVAGYKRYEISAWARADAQCRHNLNYWHFGDYLGIGAGACGKLSIRKEPQERSVGGNTHGLYVLRTRKQRMPQHYLCNERDRVAESSELSAADLKLEFMMNALRLEDGCRATLYEGRTGLALDECQPIIAAMQRDKLWSNRRDHIGLTERGQRMLNEVLLRFMPDDTRPSLIKSSPL